VEKLYEISLDSANDLDMSMCRTYENASRFLGIRAEMDRFLMNLEDRLRIMEHRSVNRLPLEGEKLVGVARRLGYREGQEHLLVEEYLRTTQSIRAIYNSILQR